MCIIGRILTCGEIRGRYVEIWGDVDLPVDRHRALEGCVHAQHCRLGHVDDRRRHERAKDAAVGDGEGSAGHVLHGQLALLGLGAELDDLLLDVGEAHLVGGAKHGHHQALRRRHGDGHVDVVAVHDLVAVDDSVHRRHLCDCAAGGGDEGRHEAELDAVLLEEGVAVLFSHLDDGGHVHLVERRQRRRDLL